MPVGSTVDTRDGKVELTSVPKAGGKPETATFYDGIFKVTQSQGDHEPHADRGARRLPEGAASAPAAAKKPKTRRLWGSGKGNFRTTGKYSAATIRGTKWLVQDSLRRDDDHGQAGRGDGPRQRQAQDDHPQGAAPLPREAQEVKRALLGAVAALLLFAAPAHAADSTVTTTRGRHDVRHGGAARLRGALNNASQNGRRRSTRSLPPGDYRRQQRAGGQRRARADCQILGRRRGHRDDAGQRQGPGADDRCRGATSTIAGHDVRPTAARRAPDDFGGDILVGLRRDRHLDHVRVTEGSGAARRRDRDPGRRQGRHPQQPDRQQRRVAPAAGHNRRRRRHLSRSIATTAGACSVDRLDDLSTTRPRSAAAASRATSDSDTTHARRASRSPATPRHGGAPCAAAAYYNSARRAPRHGSILAHNTGETSATWRRSRPVELRRRAADRRRGQRRVGNRLRLHHGRSRSTDAGVATALVMDGGHTPVLPIPADSHAREPAARARAPTSATSARPQGDALRRRRLRVRPAAGGRAGDADPDADRDAGRHARRRPPRRADADVPQTVVRGEGLRDGQGEAAGDVDLRRPRRDEEHPAQVDRGRAPRQGGADVDPEGRREARDGGVLRRHLQGHAGRQDHEPGAGRGAGGVPEGWRARGGEEAQDAAACGAPARATSARPASTARRRSAARRGSCRTRAPGR